MIRVKVELVLGGYKDSAVDLGTLTIVNNGTGDEEHGNYDVTLFTDGKEYKAKVEGWGKKLYTVWDLIYGALVALHDEHGICLKKEKVDETQY